MITAVLWISVVGFLEQLIGTLDILSTIQRKLVVNFVVVFLGVVLDMVVFRILVLNHKNLVTFCLITLVYAFVSALTSVTVIVWNKKIRNMMRRKKLQKNMAIAREHRWKRGENENSKDSLDRTPQNKSDKKANKRPADNRKTESTDFRSVNQPELSGDGPAGGGDSRTFTCDQHNSWPSIKRNTGDGTGGGSVQ